MFNSGDSAVLLVAFCGAQPKAIGLSMVKNLQSVALWKLQQISFSHSSRSKSI